MPAGSILERPELTGLIHAFYQASLDRKLLPAALERLCTVEHSKMALLASYDSIAGKAGLVAATELPVSYAQSFPESYAACDWCRTPEVGTQPGAVWVDRPGSHTCEGRASFFHQWLRPQGVVSAMHAILLRDDSKIVSLISGRSHNQGAFSETDLANHRSLLPHLQQSLLILRTLQELRADRDAAIKVLDALPIGVVLLAQDYRLFVMNDYVKEVFAREPTLKRRLQDLLARQHRRGGAGSRRDRSREAFDDTDHDIIAELVSLERPVGRRPLNLALHPITGTVGGTSAVAVLLMSDPERPPRLDLRKIRKRYGLTRTEARIAAQLAEGTPLARIADNLGKSPNTIRSHLKRIFVKTDTERQADLVLLLVGGAI
jgi:DNA-binding CsgD family transcriptional regulator